MKMNGSGDLAKDIFQEGLVVVYKKSQDEKFVIKQSSFFTYFYAVCRLTLLNYYKNSNKDVIHQAAKLHDNIDVSGDMDEEEAMARDGIKENLFHKYLYEIPKKCIKIMQLVLKGFKASVIAKRLGLSSESYVRKRKTVCLKTLVEMIKKDPKSKELL